jgi:hypothetical protein
MNLFKSVIVAVAALTAMPVMAQKSIPLVYDQEFTGAKYPAPAFPSVDEAKSLETLPNPFEFSNGKKKVKKFKDWEKRRAEIIRELYHYEVGEKPMVNKKDIEAKLEDNTLTVIVHRNGETLTITSKITYPEGDGPFPLMIGMSGISLPRNFFPERKIATMNFNMGQVMAHQQRRGSEPINKIYPEEAMRGYFEGWQQMQRESLQLAAQSFPGRKHFLLLLQDAEIRGIPALEKAADELYGGDDPAQIFCREEAFRMEYDLRTGIRSLIISLPYADAEEIRTEKEGDDLILFVRNEVRRLRLPDILCRRDLDGQTFENGELTIRFGYPYQRKQN